ncbi:MAG: DUF4440 domain-containing protein [Pseudopedobacter saltans]|uniref:DUF4440 domain-containing protein n=1 Tax=Pseudopedobacter saltans TaxID=151895 RepID=A0A2W5FEV6_9SPHI|nr:MAG: DUF4440 domain-containing protein [Pseudopedobacter saltans]
MRHSILFVICTLIFVDSVFSQKKNDQQAILDVLAKQEAAWNEGNIPAFMEGYWKNDSLAFVGSKGITYGWDNTLKKYQNGYPDTVKMGKLHFDIIRIDVMDKSHAFVIGAWHLKRSIGDVGGHFTLLFRRIKGQWVIAVDHTS